MAMARRTGGGALVEMPDPWPTLMMGRVRGAR
jgi:hypothetical protein